MVRHTTLGMAFVGLSSSFFHREKWLSLLDLVHAAWMREEGIDSSRLNDPAIGSFRMGRQGSYVLSPTRFLEKESENDGGQREEKTAKR